MPDLQVLRVVLQMGTLTVTLMHIQEPLFQKYGHTISSVIYRQVMQLQTPKTHISAVVLIVVWTQLHKRSLAVSLVMQPQMVMMLTIRVIFL